MPKKSFASARPEPDRDAGRAAWAVGRAPHLRTLVDALFALRRDPENDRARTTLDDLARAGSSSCPSCAQPFDLRGYRQTKTVFSLRETLTCACGVTVLLCDQETA
jgi:hypothetical protein